MMRMSTGISARADAEMVRSCKTRSSLAWMPGYISADLPSSKMVPPLPSSNYARAAALRAPVKEPSL